MHPWQNITVSIAVEVACADTSLPMMNPLQHGKRNDGLNPATDEIHCEAAEHAPSLLRRIKSAEPKRFDSLVLQEYPAVIRLRRIIALPRQLSMLRGSSF